MTDNDDNQNTEIEENDVDIIGDEETQANNLIIVISQQQQQRNNLFYISRTQQLTDIEREIYNQYGEEYDYISEIERVINLTFHSEDYYRNTRLTQQEANMIIQNLLFVESDEECPICMDKGHKISCMICCGNKICRECIYNNLINLNSNCPLCRQKILIYPIYKGIYITNLTEKIGEKNIILPGAKGNCVIDNYVIYRCDADYECIKFRNNITFTQQKNMFRYLSKNISSYNDDIWNNICEYSYELYKKYKKYEGIPQRKWDNFIRLIK